MKWLYRVGDAVVSPKTLFRSVLYQQQGGMGDVLLLMAWMLLGTAPMDVAIVVFRWRQGIMPLLSRLLELYLHFILVPLVACLAVGLLVAFLARRRQQELAIDRVVAAALYLWIPVGMLGLLGEMLQLAGADVSFLPHVPIAYFIRSQPPFWAVALRLLCYAYSFFLALKLLDAARQKNSPDAQTMKPALRWGAWMLSGCILLSYTVGAGAAAFRYDELRPLQNGDRAMNFELPRAEGGGVLTLQSLAGKKVLLKFWATWCPSCVSSMPELDTWAAAHPEVPVVAIDAGEPAQEVKQFLSEHRWPHIQFVLDENQSVTTAFMVDTYPSYFVIDQDGRLQAGHVGPVSRAWLDQQFGKEDKK